MNTVRSSVVLLGMMTKMPVAGVVWQNLHYLLGFRRLGYDVYYVETHARVPSMLMQREEDDGAALAAAFIDSMLRPFGFGESWAYVALHDDNRCYGLSHQRLRRLYREAAMIVNLHGGTVITPELAASGRLVYLETDPVQLQLELAAGVQESFDFLEPHVAFFSFGERLGQPGCGLPVCERFPFRPTRQPVVSDLWRTDAAPVGDRFTTIGNWLQNWRDVTFEGETYTWSKSEEFRKVLDLPSRSQARFELALSSYLPDDQAMLERHGWVVTSGMAISTDPVAYRRYVQDSKAEFTVAKDQNVRFRTGWFSDRSATYLAAGRPVITQDTGFSEILPVGEGLLTFSDVDEAAAAVEAVGRDYERMSARAREIAHEFFEADRVLAPIADALDARPVRSAHAPYDPSGEPIAPFPADLVLEPVTRWPTTLPEETVKAVRARERHLAPLRPRAASRAPSATVVIPTADNDVFLRLCLESLLIDPSSSEYELVVVDNGSGEDTRSYLATLEARWPNVRGLRIDHDAGFARAVNVGVQTATAERIVLLNDDTIVAPGALPRLLEALEDRRLGIVGPCTNRSGGESQVPATYRTYGELQRFAARFAEAQPPELLEVARMPLFCAVLPRELYEACGGLDEAFGRGLFEDDDLCERIRGRGHQIALATNVFVHHFGQASLGRLAATDEYGELFHANRRRFETKWGRTWEPHPRREDPDYEAAVERVRAAVLRSLRPGASFAIVSSGDEHLVRVPGLAGAHFQADSNGTYIGHHPADDGEAISAVRRLRAEGVEYFVVPFVNMWWLEHYKGFTSWLRHRFMMIDTDEEACVVFALQQRARADAAVAGAAHGARTQ